MSAQLFTVFVPGYYIRKEITRRTRSCVYHSIHTSSGATHNRTIGKRSSVVDWDYDFRAWMDTPPLKRELMEVES